MILLHRLAQPTQVHITWVNSEILLHFVAPVHMKGLEKISSQSWGIKLSSTLHDTFLDKKPQSPPNSCQNCTLSLFINQQHCQSRQNHLVTGAINQV